MIARTTLWGTIQVGRDFYRLPPDEQAAVLAHEQGHIHHRHALKRLWWIVSFQWSDFEERCEAQELEADRYAVEHGHGRGLLKFLFRSNLHVKSAGYPTHAERIGAIHHG